MPPKNGYLTTEQVDEFFKANGDVYVDGLREMRRLLESLQRNGPGALLIHSIYSRADRQENGKPFKASWKIKERVNYELRHGKRWFQIQDVEDIMGLTLLCADESSLQQIVDLVKGLHGDQLEIEGQPDDKTKDDNNRRAAIHLTIRLAQRPDVRCELQVKTLIQEAWDFWTHDLTYKPRSYVAAAEKTYINYVKDDLHRTEKRAAALAESIRNEWKSRDKYRVRLRQAYIAHYVDSYKAARSSRAADLPVLDQVVEQTSSAPGELVRC